MSTELTADLIVSLSTPDDPQLTRDGSRVAWVASAYGQEGDHPERAIWVAPTDGSAMGRLFTAGTGENTHPRWSPDGGTLAFLSDRAERGVLSLYAMPARGGEARALVTRKRSITSFVWSPDGAKIAFVAPDEPTEDDARRKEQRDDADVRGERWQYARPRLLAIASGAVTDLPTGDVHVQELAWSPDGTQIVYLARPTPELDDQRKAAVYVIPVHGGEPRHVCDTVGGGSQLAWASSEYIGEVLVWIGSHEAMPQCSSTAWQVPVAGGEPTVTGTAVDADACTVMLRTAPDQPRFTVAVARGLTTELVNLNTPTGLPVTVLTHPTGDLGAYSVAAPPHALVPTVAVVRSGGDAPPEIWAGAPGALHRVSDHHAPLADVRFGKQEPFFWEAPDGLALDGVLIRPPDAPPGPLPTVVLVHGGPYSRSSLGWHGRPLDWGQWLATHGYAVLMPNYRGGMGHGNRFATMARGAVGLGDWGDVLAMTNAAIARGIADGDRLGIGGWSQGGFMTAWAVTQTNRFKAGVMGAGVSDWGMMTHTSDLPTFEHALGGDAPWDGPGPHQFARLSPISFAANVTTPLLILHGKEDARVPYSQAVGFERALRGRVPVELVGYPREPHGVRERNHQRDILRRVRAWYDRWLKDG